MAGEARFRINLNQQEIEIAGDEAFVERHLERLDRMLEGFQRVAEPAAPEATSKTNTTSLGVFGEFLHHLPSTATEVDKMLAAGFYIEAHSTNGCFTTAEANRRLVEQGIKVGNPSQCVRQSLTAKRVFLFSKGQYKVSVEGRQYLRQIMGSSTILP